MQWIERKHRYLPLDTLRAVAICLVFLNHTGGFPGGRTGVDLFFVLSGYFITGGLIRSKPGPGYFSKFYLRRSLRIMPAYYLTIVLAIVIIPAASLQFAPWAAVYLGNVAYSTFGSDSALGHLWSLAVEEQFYLLWPLALWFCRSQRSRWLLIAALIVIAPFARGFFVAHWTWEAGYSLLPGRMDGLAVGAAIAMLQQTFGVEAFIKRRYPLLIISIVLLPITAFLTLHWDGTSVPYMVVGLESSLVFYAFVVAATIAFVGTWVETVMSIGPIVYIGQISYGIYLLHHWIVNIVAEHTQDLRLWTAVITVPAAMLSWHLLERPINMRGKRLLSRSSRPSEEAVPSGRP